MTGTDGYTPAEVRFGLFNRLDRLKELSVPNDIKRDQTILISELKDKLTRRKTKKHVIEGTKFATNEKVIIKNPLYLKRNAAHKPYLGPFRVEKQDNVSVWLSKEGDPTIRKEVKVSEVFRFIESTGKAVGTVDGLVTVPAVRFATTGGGGELMELGQEGK